MAFTFISTRLQAALIGKPMYKFLDVLNMINDIDVHIEHVILEFLREIGTKGIFFGTRYVFIISAYDLGNVFQRTAAIKAVEINAVCNGVTATV